MKVNIYILVFGLIAAIIVAAAVSTLFFNRNAALPSTSASNSSGILSVNVSSLTNYGPSPQISGISQWINSNGINLSQLKGKVVLVDFWTYSCINCIRSIPYLERWNQEYGSNGLVIIGIHTPEFQFEHNYSNVLNAVHQFGITYPVGLDNNYSTWDAFSNQYWPADYLIDANGDVRYVAFGEGNYNYTELVIRALLANAGYSLPSELTNTTLDVNFSQIGSPEIYLGYEKARQALGNIQGFSPNKTVNYTINSPIQNNTVFLSGEWYNAPDGMVAVNNSKIFLNFHAGSLNVVASGNSTLTIKINNSSVSSYDLGTDARNINGSTIVSVGPSRLYNLFNSTTDPWRTIEIDASPGFKIYTFTFG